MKDSLRLLLVVIAGVAALVLASSLLIPPEAPPPSAPPAPTPQPPAPDPVCPDCPQPRPWVPRQEGPVGLTRPRAPEAQVNGSVFSDGTEIRCDLPPDFHVKNRGGSDGSGLCVFASLKHSGIWQNDPIFSGLFEWMFSHPGGGYPEKVDRIIAQYCQEKNLPRPPYVQVEGTDLGILELACKNGLMPGVTYSYSPSGRYGGSRISHMVSLVHADARHFVILDNNFPKTYEWMSPDEFRKTYTGGRSGWAVIPLRPGPPPVPRNDRKGE